MSNVTLRTAGGRITCLQCTAQSKRTKQQCKAPATKGKSKCRFHGGASTGPKTEMGRLRCVEAKTIHNNETRIIRAQRSARLGELEAFDALGRTLGMIKGYKNRGRKCKTTVEFLDLDLVVRRIVKL